MKKLIITISTFFALAALTLYITPVKRTYTADVYVDADDKITYRTLADTVNWKKWHKDNPLKHSAVTISNPVAREFSYGVSGDDLSIDGLISVSRKTNWSAHVVWKETIMYKHNNIAAKLKLLFSPGNYRDMFLETVIYFKNYLENPDENMAGLEFEVQKVPPMDFVVLTDTLQEELNDVKRYELFSRMSSSLPEEWPLSNTTFLSQHEKLEEGGWEVKIAIPVYDLHEDTVLPENMVLLEQEACEAVVMHSANGITEADDVSIMYEWLKSKNVRPASGYWIKHQVKPDLAKIDAQSIIQEVYHINFVP